MYVTRRFVRTSASSARRTGGGLTNNSSKFPLPALPPDSQFTSEQADLGAQIAAKSLEIRAQIENMSRLAEPFWMVGNLYFAGVENGEVFVLTGPEGHIMFGSGFTDSAKGVEDNIRSLEIEPTDIEVILLNHYHGDQSGAAAYFKALTGARVMAGFAEVAYLEYGGSLPGSKRASARVVELVVAADMKPAGRKTAPPLPKPGRIPWRAYFQWVHTNEGVVRKRAPAN